MPAKKTTKTEEPKEPQEMAVEEPAPPIPSTLAGKLAWITGRIGAVPKKGHNPHFNYDYVMEADLVDAIRGHLAKANVIIVPSIQSVDEQPRGESRAGVTYLSHVVLRYRLINGDNPEDVIEVDWAGYGSDNADKGLYKALTGAQKYFLMKLFNVATGLEPEEDAGPAQESSRSRQGGSGRASTAKAASGTKDGGPGTPGGGQGGASEAQIRALLGVARRKNIDDPKDPAMPNLHLIAGVDDFKKLTRDEIAKLIGRIGAKDFDATAAVAEAQSKQSDAGEGATAASDQGGEAAEEAEVVDDQVVSGAAVPDGEPEQPTPAESEAEGDDLFAAFEKLGEATNDATGTAIPKTVEEPPGMDDPATETQWERAWELLKTDSTDGHTRVYEMLREKFGVTDMSKVTKRMMAEIIEGAVAKR